MVISRQDSWTNDNDLLLATIVLQNIHNGGTQLAAFKEVAKQLARTPAACGFRWNSYVRKQYEDEIQHAKQHRKAKEYKFSYKKEKELTPSPITLDDVITFLRNYKEHNDMKDLRKKIIDLTNERDSLLQRLTVYEDEYRSLLTYIDKTRNIIVGDEKEKTHS
ncbi:RsfA family transcriptional regulator [Bacillus clarus]|uniref:RsfA family transcriptional regulator n=1 Tax=Bacillus clarus TaxID=2338372 RepID=A0A090Y9Y6_9BACI|nr:RsfA family transcriptional regulator [Bacillus clarus]KFM95563.1 transcription factor, RsfA family protein [Bacillus clarus]RFT62146.1 RsfA family transcriptional regulator [Bacillus clarus]